MFRQFFNQGLAMWALHQHRLLFQVRPKMHALEHMCLGLLEIILWVTQPLLKQKQVKLGRCICAIYMCIYIYNTSIYIYVCCICIAFQKNISGLIEDLRLCTLAGQPALLSMPIGWGHDQTGVAAEFNTFGCMHGLQFTCRIDFCSWWDCFIYLG